MSSIRLFKRIKHYSDNPDSRLFKLDSLLAESIREHLSRLFQSREGMNLIDDKYGLTDVSVYRSDNLENFIDDFEIDVLDLISNYEKRLHNVRVSFSKIERDLGIIFDIKAKFNEDGSEKDIFFFLLINSEVKVFINNDKF